MKRTIAFFMTLCMLLSCSGVAYAADVELFASLTLSRYVADAFSGDSRGEIIIRKMEQPDLKQLLIMNG